MAADNLLDFCLLIVGIGNAAFNAERTAGNERHVNIVVAENHIGSPSNETLTVLGIIASHTDKVDVFGFAEVSDDT